MGKGYFGYGANKTSALEPLIVECQSVQVALFGMTQWYNATRISEGTCTDRSRSLFRAIEECRNRGCFVIVLPHWNYEYADYPSPASARLAQPGQLRFCIKAFSRSDRAGPKASRNDSS
ncbi:MAG: CapA family protein [Planctomycetota bacterium]